MALQLTTWTLEFVLGLSHSSSLSKSHLISEPQFSHLESWLLLEINDIKHLAQCLALSPSSVTLSECVLWGFLNFGNHSGTRIAMGCLLLLISGCLPRLFFSTCVAVTTQASTWGKALSMWINIVVVCICPGAGVVACVIKGEFQLSLEVSHWNLGSGGQKSKGACFGNFMSSFGACSWNLSVKMPLPLFTIYSNPTERPFGPQEKEVLESDTLGFNPVSATVLQCDLWHAFKYFLLLWNSKHDG